MFATSFGGDTVKDVFASYKILKDQRPSPKVALISFVVSMDSNLIQYTYLLNTIPKT